MVSICFGSKGVRHSKTLEGGKNVAKLPEQPKVAQNIIVAARVADVGLYRLADLSVPGGWVGGWVGC